jgi:hypothetical protein
MINRLAISTLLLLAAGLATSPPASALTPLRSPEQLAQDKILFARASENLKPQVMRCFAAPTGAKRRPVTIRFFLAGAGKQVSQLEAFDRQAGSRTMERAAIRAIKICAPYVVLEELRNWGGFWATITFK